MLFEANNSRVEGLYAWEFTGGKYGREAFQAIRKHFKGGETVNRAKDTAYSSMESD